MHRDPESHKGDNGKVAVIGGSRLIHGAPLFSALAAEAVGCDLLYVCVPQCHSEIAKSTSLNFFVQPFAGNELSKGDVEPILELLATMDAAVIGPGLARTPQSIRVLLDIVAEATCALVLDATALQPELLTMLFGKTVVLTPHLGELERLGIPPNEIGNVAVERNLTIHLKGHTDHIASPSGKVAEVKGGNPGLTVGGTGDALAGCIAGLLAQHAKPAEACELASHLIKGAGDELLKHQATFTTREVIAALPAMLHTIAA